MFLIILSYELLFITMLPHAEAMQVMFQLDDNKNML